MLQPAKIGHVIEHHHRADAPAQCVVQCRPARLQHALVIAVDDHVVVDRLVAGQGPRDETPQVGVAHDFLQRSPLGLLLIDAQQQTGGFVEADDPLLVVDRDHTFDHAAEHGALFVVLADDDSDAVLQLLGHLIERVGQAGQFFGIGH